jgi:subfamily B ATP-binding cassette protein MsbA
MFYLNWQLTAASLIVGPLIVLIIRTFSKRLRAMSRAEQAAMGDLNHVLEESIGCHRVVKVFGGQEYEAGRLARAVNKVRSYNMKMSVAASANVPLTQIVGSFAVAGIIYFITLQATRDQTTVGGFIAFLGALLMLLAPLKRLTGVSATLQRGLAAAETVFEMIDERAEEDAGAAEIGRARGEIEFRNVTFTYTGGGRPALDNVSLRIAAGETVAPGASPSGRPRSPTPRFTSRRRGRSCRRPDTGSCSCEPARKHRAGEPGRDVNDTVAANIGYGRLGTASDADVIAAAEAAHAMGSSARCRRA